MLKVEWLHWVTAQGWELQGSRGQQSPGMARRPSRPPLRPAGGAARCLLHSYKSSDVGACFPPKALGLDGSPRVTQLAKASASWATGQAPSGWSRDTPRAVAPH